MSGYHTHPAERPDPGCYACHPELRPDPPEAAAAPGGADAGGLADRPCWRCGLPAERWGDDGPTCAVGDGPHSWRDHPGYAEAVAW